VTRIRAAGVYDGTLRAAIHALKYDGRRSLARPLAALMLTHAGDVLTGADAVVPVPLHPSRHRSRGFNQATDLARPLGPPLVHALRRRRATTPQADLPAALRHANVREAFAATRALRRWRGATLVLVDDVSTTGATLDACASVLLEAGAGEVRAITAARAVKSQP
jgi:ComF family protein